MRKLHIILALAFGPALIAACFAFLMPQGGSAYNTYVNEYRKWPWRAGASHTITTLPNHWPHAGTWCQHDIDVDGSFKVHSSSSRGIVRKKYYAPDDNNDGISGGYTLDIQEEDGLQYHVYYLHLESPGGFDNVYVGARIYQGQWIANSSNSGCSTCGTHLHLGMSTQAYGDGGANIPIFPLAGFADEDDISATSYDSDNAGIGDACAYPCTEATTIDGTYYSDFTEQYRDHGGYSYVGVTWDSCQARACWWVHYWNDGDYDKLPAWLDNLLCPTDVDGDTLAGDNDPDCDFYDPSGSNAEFIDGVEFRGYGLKPAVVDSDADGCADWIEIVDVNGSRQANISDVYLVAKRVNGLLGAESGTWCDNNIDDDSDGRVNDGCPEQAPAPETGSQCDNDIDDDGDGKVNDGCPLATDPASDYVLDTDKDGDIDTADAYLAAKNSSLVKPHSTCASEG